MFPPGLEALYRQAGFPSAFLSSLGGAGGGAGSNGGSMSGGRGMGGMDSSPIGNVGSPGMMQNIGLQSHAANPTRKFNLISYKISYHLVLYLQQK